MNYSLASGGQGLFLKKPPLDPTKTFIMRSHYDYYDHE